MKVQYQSTKITWCGGKVEVQNVRLVPDKKVDHEQRTLVLV